MILFTQYDHDDRLIGKGRVFEVDVPYDHIITKEALLIALDDWNIVQPIIKNEFGDPVGSGQINAVNEDGIFMEIILHNKESLPKNPQVVVKVFSFSGEDTIIKEASVDIIIKENIK